MKVLISGASGSFGLELVKHLGVFDTDTGSLRYGEINKQQNSKLLNCDVFIHCRALLHGNFDNIFNSNVLLTKHFRLS
jgi:dTDP-4-dehydrorhamnose reductase